MGPRFIVIIDEAHRGMRTKSDENNAVTIIQRFLRGSDDMRAAPLVLGISATPQRFNDLVAGTRTVHPVHVDAADVRSSGLLKERIVLHHSSDGQQIDITLLGGAPRHWHDYTERWATYCTDQGERPVVPLLIVQVENAPKGKGGSRTDLATTIRAINEELPAALPNSCVRSCLRRVDSHRGRWVSDPVPRTVPEGQGCHLHRPVDRQDGPNPARETSREGRNPQLRVAIPSPL